jgi:hypothetical protein
VKELLIGCGSNSEKKICLDSVEWHDLTRLDNNPDHNPDVETLIFLDQSSYDQVGQTTMSDFRHIYKANFKLIFSQEDESGYYFILQKV